MMRQICGLETVEPQEILINVCVMFYNIEICYRGCGEKKTKFSFNLFCYFKVKVVLIIVLKVRVVLIIVLDRKL